MRRKTTALVVLLLIMACTCYVTSAPLSVAPSASLSLYSFLNSFSGTAVTFAGDPVGGGPGGGGD